MECSCFLFERWTREWLLAVGCGGLGKGAYIGQRTRGKCLKGVRSRLIESEETQSSASNGQPSAQCSLCVCQQGPKSKF